MEWLERFWRWMPVAWQVSILGALAVIAGLFEKWPLSVLIVIAIWSFTGALCLVGGISETFDRIAAKRTKKHWVRDVMAQQAIDFQKLEGRARSHERVENEATQLFNDTSHFLNEHLGFSYAAKLKVAQQPLQRDAVHIMGPEGDLIRRLQARREYLVGLVDSIDTLKIL